MLFPSFASTTFVLLALFHLCHAAPMVEVEKRSDGQITFCAEKNFSMNLGVDFNQQSLNGRVSAAAPDPDHDCTLFSDKGCGGVSITVKYPRLGVPNIPDFMDNMTASYKCTKST